MKKIAILLVVAVSLPLACANAQRYSPTSGKQITFQRGGVQFSFGSGRALPTRHGGCDANCRIHRSDSSHSCDGNHSRQTSHSSCGSDRIRLIAGYQRGKGTRPSGWHDKSWFRKRGYNLDNYAHIHEKTGVVHYGRNVRRPHDSHHNSRSRGDRHSRDSHHGHGH